MPLDPLPTSSLARRGARTRLSLLARLAASAALGLLLATSCQPVPAVDLGIEGAVFEPIEEDFRLMLMRLLARQDWTRQAAALEQSAREYTRNLPGYFVVRADETKTVWKDVGVVATEDITLPYVDHQTGSVFEPEQRVAVKAGTYVNPLYGMPSAAIERLFIFDATDAPQMALAKELMRENIPQLSFMIVAGDLGPIAEEMNRPIYHPAPTMLDKFHITAVPSLIGFGKGIHRGHMAVTQFHMPVSIETIKSAWFGLPHPGYTPSSIQDFDPAPTQQSRQPASGAAPAPKD